MEIPNFDKLIFPLFNEPYNAYLNAFFIIVSYSIYFYITFTMAYFYKRKKGKQLILYASELLIGLAIVTFLKYSIKRPRPAGENLILRTDPSFPSRHSFTSMFTLRFLYPYFRGLSRALLIIYSIMIPISTIYVGVHYPSDTMVGSILGLILPSLLPERYVFRFSSFLWRIYQGLRRLIGLT